MARAKTGALDADLLVIDETWSQPGAGNNQFMIRCSSFFKVAKKG